MTPTNIKEEVKKTYYKMVDEEYPGGMIFERKADALEVSRDTRDCGGTAYVRAIRMTETEFNSYPEL